MICKLCKRNRELRDGHCWDCVEMESLIQDGEDMDGKPVQRAIAGTDGLNILHQILTRYGVLRNDNKNPLEQSEQEG